MINIIIGKQGQGKTSLLKKIILNKISSQIIFDLTGEYNFLKDHNFNILKTYTEFNINITDPFLKFVFDLREPDFIKYFVPVILNRGNLNIYFDECHLIAKDKSISKLLRFSRQREIDLYFISHRIYDLPVIFRAMVEKLFLFNIQGPEDLEYLKRFIGDKIIDNIRALNKFEYFEIDVRAGLFIKKNLTNDF